MKKTLIIIATTLIILSTLPLTAATIKVKQGESLQTIFNTVKNGDTIVISAGIYETNEVLRLTEKKDITIKGTGFVDIICNYYVHVMIISKCTGIKLENLHMVHKLGATVDSCEGANVVCIYYSNNIEIKNCELNGCGMIGIYAYDCPELTVTDCYIHSNTTAGIHLRMKESQPQKIIITNNRIINNDIPIDYLGQTIFEDTIIGKKLLMKGNTIYPETRPAW